MHNKQIDGVMVGGLNSSLVDHGIFLLISIEHLPIAGEFRVMVINATFINISVISWR
jgi:hypothetical protein